MTTSCDREICLSVADFAQGRSDSEAIEAALACLRERAGESPARLVLAPLVYRLTRPVELVDWERLTVEGNGASLIVTAYVSALRMENCRRVAVKDLSVDYDPLYFTQGTIATIEDREMLIRIDEGYRDDYENFLSVHPFVNIRLHDPITGGHLAGSTDDYEIRVLERLEPRVLRVLLSIPYTDPASYRPRVGDRASLYQCWVGAVSLHRCTDTLFENFNLYASGGFGLHEKCGGGGTVLKNCNIVPGPRPVGATAPRLLSTLGDASHFQSVEKGPRLEGCRITHCCDDGINAHGFFFRVTALEGEDVFLSVIGDDPWAVGDRVHAFAGGSYALRGSATITEFERVEGYEIAEENRAILGNTGYVKGIAYRLRLSEPIPGLMVGDDMTDLNRMASGAVVKDCTFGYNRARGIVLKGWDCSIENNTIAECSAAGIMVISELSWAEAGFPVNTVVRNNTLVHTCLSSRARHGSAAVAGIMVLLDAKNGGFFPCRELRNITVEGNRVTDCGTFGIFLSNCTGASVKNNRVEEPFAAGVNNIGACYGVAPRSGILCGMAADVVAEGNSLRCALPEIDRPVELLESCVGASVQRNNILLA